MSTVLSSIPIFWTDSIIGYIFFIFLVSSILYKLVRF